MFVKNAQSHLGNDFSGHLIDPHKLGIRCRVNGETMQNSSTENLVFKTEALVSFISR